MEETVLAKTSSRALRHHKKTRRALDLGLALDQPWTANVCVVNIFHLFGDVYFTVVLDIMHQQPS